MGLDTEVRFEDRGAVRWITLDRPASRNGITVDVVERLTGLFHSAASDDAVRVVVLSGAGGSFCSGLDLKAAMMNPVADRAAGMQTFHALVRALWRLEKPTIAAIDGAAAGFGADLALACDIRIASPRARLGERFVRIGLMPDGGATFTLPRLVGLSRAYEMIYSGCMIEADEALQIGLVSQLLPQEGYEAAVQAFAEMLAQSAPLAMARAKRAVQAGLGDIEVGLAAEAAGQLELLESGDFAEGVQAFLMKREPSFKGT